MPASSDIVCILNGLTDVGLEDLGGLTPLQKAQHPAMDILAQSGECKLALPPPYGGFETALLSLLGVHEGGQTARGPLEAYALGRRLQPGEVAFCVRFVHAAGGIIVDLSDHLVADQEAAALCRALSDERCEFLPLSGPNAILVTSDEELIRGAQPHEPLAPADLAGRSWTDLVPGAVHGSRWQSLLEGHEINALKMELDEPSANALLLTDGGHEPEVSGALSWDSTLFFSGDFVSRGIARRLGIPLWQPPGGVDRLAQVQELVRSLPALLGGAEQLFIELDLLWESTYAGNLLEKVKRIEWLDKQLIAPLKNYCDAYDARLHLLTLRPTDIRRGAVLAGPVPVVSYPGDRPLPAFDETVFSAITEAAPLQELLR